MSFRRTFRDEARRQVSPQAESEAVGRIRYYAAGLSLIFGMIGAVAIFPLIRGDVSWAAAPGCALMVAGGVLGWRAQRTAEVVPSRRLGVLAAICTVVGFAEFFVVSRLT